MSLCDAISLHLLRHVFPLSVWEEMRILSPSVSWPFWNCPVPAVCGELYANLRRRGYTHNDACSVCLMAEDSAKYGRRYSPWIERIIVDHGGKDLLKKIGVHIKKNKNKK